MEYTPWLRLFSGNLDGSPTSGRIFTFKARSKFRSPSECSFPGNSVPDADTTTLTYHIRFQFRQGTKVVFDRPVGGRKTWDLGPRSYSEPIVMMYWHLPDYGLDTGWNVGAASAAKLDGTETDFLQSYLEGRANLESFEVPGDTEILTLTYTRTR